MLRQKFYGKENYTCPHLNVSLIEKGCPVAGANEEWQVELANLWRESLTAQGKQGVCDVSYMLESPADSSGHARGFLLPGQTRSGVVCLRARGQLKASERFPVAGANEEWCRTCLRARKREASCCRGK